MQGTQPLPSPHQTTSYLTYPWMSPEHNRNIAAMCRYCRDQQFTYTIWDIGQNHGLNAQCWVYYYRSGTKNAFVCTDNNTKWQWCVRSENLHAIQYIYYNIHGNNSALCIHKWEDAQSLLHSPMRCVWDACLCINTFSQSPLASLSYTHTHTHTHTHTQIQNHVLHKAVYYQDHETALVFPALACPCYGWWITVAIQR